MIFFSKVAQNRKGSFNGSIEGRERVQRMLRETDFSLPDKVKEFLTKVWTALHCDLRSEQKPPVHVVDQLAKGERFSKFTSTFLASGI